MDPLAAARRIASVGLPGQVQTTGPLEIADAMWPDLLRLVTRQRITGLASAAAREGTLVLTEAQRDELLDRHRSAMAMVLLLEDLLRKVSSAMASADVPTTVLKGAAVADTFYPDPTWRAYGDLDLLVAVQRWRQACRTLTELGFRRLIPEPRTGFDERFGKGASFEDAQGLQVDLHRTLAPGPFGLWIDTDALVESTVEFHMKGMQLRRLDDTHALIHACIHAALGRQEPLLVPLRDVLQIAWSGRVDWERTTERVGGWRLSAPVSHAFRVAKETFGVRLPDEAMAVIGLGISRVERRALAAYTTERRQRGGPALAALWAIPGVRPRISYVRTLLVPEPRFLDEREGGRSGGLRRRLTIPLRWAVGRLRRGIHGGGSVAP